MIHHFAFRPIGPFLKSRAIICCACLVWAVSPCARSQDAVRPSLAGEAASEARHQDIERLPYNLLVGPLRFRLSATMGVEYNDNINLSEVNTQDDFILRPQINFDAIWPVTQINTLRLDLGLGLCHLSGSFQRQHQRHSDLAGVPDRFRYLCGGFPHQYS